MDNLKFVRIVQNINIVCIVLMFISFFDWFRTFNGEFGGSVELYLILILLSYYTGILYYLRNKEQSSIDFIIHANYGLKFS